MEDKLAVLVVDDDILSVNGVIGGVDWEALNATPLRAYSSKDAQETINRQQVHILVCDIEMPGENGIQLLEWVRQQHSGLECIFLTSHDNFRYAQKALKLDTFDYLLKPTPYDELQQAIARAGEKLRQKKKDRELIGYGSSWYSQKIGQARQSAGNAPSSTEIVAQARNYILEHLSENLSVESLAKQFYISSDHLTRLFKKQQGVTVMDYIVGERIRLAARMLEETELSANVIAESVGYHSYTHFSKMFKKIHGVGPSQYRENKPQSLAPANSSAEK